tara:strand:+ start:1189 stop:1698 length:510 start_codon:yes stop_codon:yes gene_type:complete
VYDFLKSHSSFLNSRIKQIEFNYLINSDDSSLKEKAHMILSDSSYKLLLNNHIITSNTQFMQTYHKQTNQIFIENSFSEINHLIFNFFNYLKDDLIINDSLNNNLYINSDYGSINILITKNLIDSINIQMNDNNTLYLFDIKLFPYADNSMDTLFIINKPDAFILDLRD